MSDVDDTDEAREARDPRTSPSRLGQLARASDALALLVARNPSATPRLLARIARRLHRDVREAVCRHPNTPDAVAFELAESFPEAFAQSDRGRAFLAEATHRAPRANHLRARLQWAGAPPEWFERAAEHPLLGVRLTVTENAPTLTEAVVERLVRDVDPRVRAALARRMDTHPRWVATLARDPDAGVRIAVARRRQLDADVVGALACDPEATVRVAVAARSDLTVSLLVAFARDPDVDVRRAAAAQPAMPVEELVRLSREAHPFFSGVLAANPSTPTEVLERLAAPPPDSPYLAEALAAHPNANGTVLTSLLAHPEDGYRRAVVSRARALPRELWERLMNDPSRNVRWTLGYRKDVPFEVLRLFAGAACQYLRGAAAMDGHTPRELVARLARDPDQYVRSCVARNPRAPDALMHGLAADPSRSVRDSVARHARSASVLESLARDRDPGIRDAVAYNPATPPDLKRALELDPEVQLVRRYY